MLVFYGTQKNELISFYYLKALLLQDHFSEEKEIFKYSNIVIFHWVGKNNF